MDRVLEAYEGTWGGPRIQRETRERMDWLLERISGPRVLDVGCSQGLLPILLAQKHDVEVVGIDILDEAIGFAQSALRQAGQLKGSVSFRRADFMNVPPPSNPDECFDCVVIGQVLEHLPDPRAFLLHASMFLRPGGAMLVTVPYGQWDHDEHEQTFYARDLMRLIDGILPIVELDLVGARLAAVLADGAAEPIEMTNVIDREYRFFQMKERRLLAEAATTTRKLSAIVRRLQALCLPRTAKRRIRRLSFVVVDSLHPGRARARLFNSATIREIRRSKLVTRIKGVFGRNPQ